MKHILLVMLVLLPDVGLAEIYRWVDDQGRVHFGDAPEESVRAEAVEIKVQTINTVKIDYLPEWVSKEVEKRARVVMYSTEWCNVCVRAKRYFRANDVRFTEKDIEKSKDARAEFDRLQGRGVPLILVGKQKMSGFSEARFESLYAGPGD